MRDVTIRVGKLEESAMVAIAIAQIFFAATIKQHKMECEQPCEGFQVPLNVEVEVSFYPACGLANPGSL